MWEDTRGRYAGSATPQTLAGRHGGTMEENAVAQDEALEASQATADDADDSADQLGDGYINAYNAQR